MNFYHNAMPNGILNGVLMLHWYNPNHPNKIPRILIQKILLPRHAPYFSGFANLFDAFEKAVRLIDF